MFDEKEGQTHFCQQCEELKRDNLALQAESQMWQTQLNGERLEWDKEEAALKSQYNAAQERIHQFDRCIRAVADALNAPACGGVDTDINDPYGTTAVLVGRAKELADRVCKADDRVKVLSDELRNIAEAKRFNREHFDDDRVFADWAQSRARHTLNATPQQTAEQIEHVCSCKKYYDALLDQIKIAQEATDEIGIIGQIGSQAWLAQIRKLKPLVAIPPLPKE